MNQELRKIIGAILILSIILPNSTLLRPREAEAAVNAAAAALSVPIYETGTLPGEAKEGFLGMGFGWDSIGYILAKMALSSLTNSIVNWINSGFEGNPSFLNNPANYFKDLANEASGIFISQLGLEPLCEPFKADILLGLKYSYRVEPMQKFKCTVEDAVENWDDFMDDFSAGGWEGWLSMTTQPQNNPYGLYLMGLDEMEARVAAKVDIGRQEMSWGSGFLTLKDCEGGVSQVDYCSTKCGSWYDNEGIIMDDDCYTDCTAAEMSTSELCEAGGGQMQNTTPGKIIAEELATAMGSSFRQLEMADEIEESLAAIFNALINQLINQGLRSLASESSGGTGEWQKTEPPEIIISGVQESAITSINLALDAEYQYRDTKQDSVDVYDWAISKINELVKCYEAQIAYYLTNDAVKASELQTIVNNQLIPLISLLESQKVPFEAAVEESSGLIAQAEVIKEEILVTQNHEEIQEFLKEFKNEIMPLLHSMENVINAKSEFENTVKPYLEEVIDGTEEEDGIQDLLDACIADCDYEGIPECE